MKSQRFSKQVRTEIVIDAPRQAVWDALVAFEQYPKWNPVIPYASGTAVEGSTLQIRRRMPGSKEDSAKLKIVEVNPFESLRWRGHFFFVVLIGDNVMSLEPISGNRTRLLQRETFRGLLVLFGWPRIERTVSAAFVEILAALKTHVESKGAQ